MGNEHSKKRQIKWENVIIKKRKVSFEKCITIEITKQKKRRKKSKNLRKI